LRSVDPDVEVPTWEEVARDYGRFIYTVAFRLTGDHEEAQDLVQDVLLRVRRGLRTYQPGNMRGWLSRITTNAFYDQTRSRKRRPTVALPDDPERILPPSAGSDAEYEAGRLPEEVQAALLSVPEDYRAIVVLSDVVGLSYQEIAEQTSIPLGTVRSRLHRGRARLRDALADDDASSESSR
jgi:RNA polymerase sigma-70 factor, ECF subfamily